MYTKIYPTNMSNAGNPLDDKSPIRIGNLCSHNGYWLSEAAKLLEPGYRVSIVSNRHWFNPQTSQMSGRKECSIMLYPHFYTRSIFYGCCWHLPRFPRTVTFDGGQVIGLSGPEPMDDSTIGGTVFRGLPFAILVWLVVWNIFYFSIYWEQ